MYQRKADGTKGGRLSGSLASHRRSPAPPTRNLPPLEKAR
jgi:hypothetical protein